MSSVSHDANVERTGVATLPHGDGVHKLVFELAQLAQKVGLHKVHHCVVCREEEEEEEEEEEDEEKKSYFSEGEERKRERVLTL